MRIAKEGYPLIFTAAILTLLAFLAGWGLRGRVERHKRQRHTPVKEEKN